MFLITRPTCVRFPLLWNASSLYIFVMVVKDKSLLADLLRLPSTSGCYREFWVVLVSTGSFCDWWGWTLNCWICAGVRPETSVLTLKSYLPGRLFSPALLLIWGHTFLSVFQELHFLFLCLLGSSKVCLFEFPEKFSVWVTFNDLQSSLSIILYVGLHTNTE